MVVKERFDVEIQARSAGEEWMIVLANPFGGEAGIAPAPRHQQWRLFFVLAPPRAWPTPWQLAYLPKVGTIGDPDRAAYAPQCPCSQRSTCKEMK